MSNYQKHDSKIKKIKVDFFEYMVDHTIQCSDKWCICKASTFQDTMREIFDLTRDDNEIRDLKEALGIEWDHKWH